MKKNISNEFKCDCPGHGNHIFKIGKIMASSVSGFIAGLLVASIGWGLFLYLYLIEKCVK